MNPKDQIPTSQELWSFVSLVAQTANTLKSHWVVTPELARDRQELRRAYIALCREMRAGGKIIEAHSVYGWITSQLAYQSALRVVRRRGFDIGDQEDPEREADALLEMMDEVRSALPESKTDIEKDDLVRGFLAHGAVEVNAYEWIQRAALALERYYYQPVYTEWASTRIAKAMNGLLAVERMLDDGVTDAYADFMAQFGAQEAADELNRLYKMLFDMRGRLKDASIAVVPHVRRENLRERQYVWDLRAAFLSVFDEELVTAIAHMFNMPGILQPAPSDRTIARWLSEWRNLEPAAASSQDEDANDEGQS